jgi:hypothetical protein
MLDNKFKYKSSHVTENLRSTQEELTPRDLASWRSADLGHLRKQNILQAWIEAQWEESSFLLSFLVNLK